MGRAPKDGPLLRQSQINALEIFRLRKTDWMIRRMSGAFEFMKTAAAFADRIADRIIEFGRRNMSRTRCRHEDASIAKQSQAVGGQSAIGLNRPGPFQFAARQRRWIKHH